MMKWIILSVTISQLLGCMSIYDVECKLVLSADIAGKPKCKKDNIKFNISVPDYNQKTKLYSITDVVYSNQSNIMIDYELGWGVRVLWGMDIPDQEIAIDFICGDVIQSQKKVTIPIMHSNQKPVFVKM